MKYSVFYATRISIMEFDSAFFVYIDDLKKRLLFTVFILF